ncbi:MAG: T9SS type A sorting domain-containing protein [Dysgonamonadaceae bacterium]|jgi:hypothetical protein|nr:T9SS type A sorting domain-containing protein [Dysgonamonadaceae bacterium]
MKNKFLCCLLLLLAGTGGAMVAQDALYVYGTGSAPQSFDLDAISKVTFTADEIRIHSVSDGSVTGLLFDEVEKLTFGAATTAISGLAVSNGVNLYWKDDRVFIESGAEIISVALYSIQGGLLQRAHAETLHATSLQTPAYPVGVYIVQVISKDGISSHKIIKH